MQIQVKCGCSEENCPEWAIVEMQGVVQIQPAFQHSLQNLQIGRLCKTSSQGTYTFTVGYHELSGSRIPLKKPLLVLKKKKYVDPNDPTEPNSSKAEMEVIGIIRHRILFKTRPKALISSVQPFVKGKAAETSSVVQ
ncbi:hypothetical protein ACHQM5_000756 [Ranunculus cassubicifolius]